MKLDTSLVGTHVVPHERTVEWRQTTNYAAAVGDINPRYLDDSTPEGLVAPPLFAVAATWPVVTNFQGQLSGLIDPNILTTMVHGSEHLLLHNPIRPGGKIHIEGEVVAIFPTRAGTHVVLRLDAEDTRGTPLFTEYMGAVFRGVACDGDPEGREELPQIPALAEENPLLWAAEVPVSRAAPYLYDGCSDIVFPIHTSVAFAHAVGLPDILLQGTATLAMAAREILDREAAGEPSHLKEIACRFSGMVVPGGAIRVELNARQRDGQDTVVGFRVLAPDGKVALSHGFARICADTAA